LGLGIWDLGFGIGDWGVAIRNYGLWIIIILISLDKVDFKKS
jgi:hypothetical protein